MTIWSSRADTAPETIRAIQSGLAVRLAMTPRSEFMTCSPLHTVAATATRNVDRYSVLPVLVDDRICGLYDAERWFDVDEPPCCPIGNDFERLCEDHLIGGDASILDFIATATERPARLVVSESRVVGLVCLADLQKLPVRAALFSVVTALEIAMADRIRSLWPDSPEGWLDLLSAPRRKDILNNVRKAQTGDAFVSHILSTQFIDKANIVRKMELLPGSQRALKSTFETIQRLRDNLAHANDYAATRSAAESIAPTVATIMRFIADLRTQTPKQTT